jgi:hypothetical protein
MTRIAFNAAIISGLMLIGASATHAEQPPQPSTTVEQAPKDPRSNATVFVDRYNELLWDAQTRNIKGARDLQAYTPDKPSTTEQADNIMIETEKRLETLNTAVTNGISGPDAAISNEGPPMIGRAITAFGLALYDLGNRISRTIRDIHAAISAPHGSPDHNRSMAHKPRQP